MPGAETDAQVKVLKNIVEEAKLKLQLVKTNQDYVRVLRETGHSYEDIAAKLKATHLPLDVLTKSMDAYYRSVDELSKLTPSAFINDFKRNLMSIGQAVMPVLTLGAIVKGLRELDEVGARTNRIIGAMALQTGRFQDARGSSFAVGGILGGMVGRTAGDPLQSVVSLAQLQLRALGVSAEDAAKLIIQTAVMLPRKAIDQGIGPAAAAMSKGVADTFQVDVGMASQILVDQFRRGSSGITEVSRAMQTVQKSANSSSMANAVYLESVNSLWTATRNLGVGFLESNAIVSQFDKALSSGIMTIQDIAGIESRTKEMPFEKIVALASMARGTEQEKTMFGGGKSLFDQAGFFLGRLQGEAGYKKLDIAGEMLPLVQSIMEKQAAQIAGRGASVDALRGARDIVRQQLLETISPFAGGRQEFRVLLEALGKPSYLGEGKLVGGGVAKGRTPEAVYAEMEKSASTFLKASEAYTKESTGVVAATGRLVGQLTLMTSAFARGDTVVANRALQNASGTIRSSAILNTPEKAFDVAVQKMFPVNEFVQNGMGTETVKSLVPTSAVAAIATGGLSPIINMTLNVSPTQMVDEVSRELQKAWGGFMDTFSRTLKSKLQN
jgi:hypothetical protein